MLEENKYNTSIYNKLNDVLVSKYGTPKMIIKGAKALEWLSKDRKTYISLSVTGGIRVLYAMYGTDKGATKKTDRTDVLNADDF